MISAVLRLACPLFALCVASMHHAAAAAPSFHGIFVVVDPYRVADMTFLSCAAGLTPPVRQQCTVTPTSNPFIAADAGSTPAATGVLLRLPWCGFQTDRQPHYTPVETGSCHYRVQDAPGAIGSYYAGQFSGPARALQIAATPAQQVDQYIDNLSGCSGRYDECAGGVLSDALAAVAAINKTTPLSLAVGLVAGVYTPISVMQRVGTIDLPILDDSTTNFCARQPLAWRTNFIKAYKDTLRRLVSDIEGYAGAPPIQILKASSIVEASLEFNVDARPATYPTQLDPGGTVGVGVANDPVLLCPDHLPPHTDGSPQTGIDVLLSDYNAQPLGQGTMADAYEGALGATIGFEASLLPSGAILSIPTTGQQLFAHAACDRIVSGPTDGQVVNQPLASTPCVADPSPGVANYDWSEYYFTRFVGDLFVPGTVAYSRAAAAYAAERGGVYALSRQQLAVMFTALQPELPNPIDLAALPACWLNNTSTKPPRAKDVALYTTPSSSDLVSIPGPVIGTPGTVLGWQTATLLTATPTYGDTCTTQTSAASYADALNTGVANGGKFIEIETDAASDSNCWSALAATVATLLPDNRVSNHCVYD